MTLKEVKNSKYFLFNITTVLIFLRNIENYTSTMSHVCCNEGYIIIIEVCTKMLVVSSCSEISLWIWFLLRQRMPCIDPLGRGLCWSSRDSSRPNSSSSWSLFVLLPVHILSWLPLHILTGRASTQNFKSTFYTR